MDRAGEITVSVSICVCVVSGVNRILGEGFRLWCCLRVSSSVGAVSSRAVLFHGVKTLPR
jgi:hypothetical protein